MTNEKKQAKKKVKEICKNCKLFNAKESWCQIVVLHEGERHHLPVHPNDKCFFETEFLAANEEGELETFKPEIKEVKFWVEDPVTGEKTDQDGIVKVQYPDGFFGDEE